VSEAEAVLLGFIAGLTVLLGMPLARRLRSGQVLLNSLSCGVLVYLLGDMLARAFVPLNSALLRQYDNLDGAEPVVWLTVAFIGGLVLGYGGLTAYAALSGVTDTAVVSAAALNGVSGRLARADAAWRARDDRACLSSWVGRTKVVWQMRGSVSRA